MNGPHSLSLQKKKKKEKDDHIGKAVFIIPHDSVNEKVPLIGEEKEKSCCCTIM